MNKARFCAATGGPRRGAAPGRLATAAAIAAIGLGAVTGCSSSSPAAAGPTATAFFTGAASPSAASSPSGTASPAATPALAPSASPAGPAPCLSRYLGAKVGLTQGTAGSTYIVIDFTNLNNASCTLDGYPGVSLAGGKPVT